MRGANAPAGLAWPGLASRPIRVLLPDGYPKSAGTEGDPVDMAERRTSNIHNKKIVHLRNAVFRKIFGLVNGRLDNQNRSGVPMREITNRRELYLRLTELRAHHQHNALIPRLRDGHP